jgi:hypothetical protein
MDLARILKHLREELEHLDTAIRNLERLAEHHGRHGRAEKRPTRRPPREPRRKSESEGRNTGPP